MDPKGTNSVKYSLKIEAIADVLFLLLFIYVSLWLVAITVVFLETLILRLGGHRVAGGLCLLSRKGGSVDL